jgi:hypothetical protein
LDTILYYADLKNAITEGVIIPTRDGEKDNFTLSFKLKNKSNQAKKYFYKIFYQNNTYAFDLFLDKLHHVKNPKANKNFYGSWNVLNAGFHETPLVDPDQDFVQITDTFCIMGNPRNEKSFFGAKSGNLPITSKEIAGMVGSINDSKEWLAQIKKKADENNIPVQKQVKMDAVWIINSNRQNGNYNNRWKRNPRVGTYEFLLVVIEEENLNKIPHCYQDVTIKDSVLDNYQNPFFYYLNTENKAQFHAEIANQKLQVKIKYELNKGVYSGNNGLFAFSEEVDSSYYIAQLEQYYHSIDNRHEVKNIPIVTDILENKYTADVYASNVSKYSDTNLKEDHIKITSNPGSTVGYDDGLKAIFLKNPGNVNKDTFRKENVGLETRHGFTYGKYIAKIKFPKIINTSYVWNGITCAYWLKYQNGSWNKRSDCELGYNPKLPSDTLRPKSSVYSEIDIEIVKTSKHWPKSSYGYTDDYPKDDALNDNIILSCTNWDLACHDSKNFNIGVNNITYQGNVFGLHRWDDDYRALTSKYEISQDKVLGNEMYYVIEWNPTNIIWKIGPTLDNLTTFGFMDKNNTMIPDNQMQMVFTQEYHLSEWWPLTPFKQEYIPYPLNDLVGYIYEISIE